MRQCSLVVGLVSLVCLADSAQAQDSLGKAKYEYFSVDAGELVSKYNARHVVSKQPLTQNAWYQSDSNPRVVVPENCEAYLLTPERSNKDYLGYKIVGRKPVGEAIEGRFFVLRRDKEKPQESVLARFKFKVSAEQAIEASEDDYWKARGEHYQRLWSEDMAGAAMFRHLAVDSLKRVGETAKSSGPSWRRRSRDGIDDTIRLMSGGRAVSENLQLDQQLEITDESGRLVSLSGVRGVTVREIDWTSRLKKEETELDPLARLVPHDQYAVFVPSFAALATIIDKGNELARPAVQWIEPQSRQTDVLSFYQQQMGLPLTALTRQVGGALIDEVAVTGSDPYFRTGTDIAVLMQSGQPEFLRQAISTQIATQANAIEGVSQSKQEYMGRSISHWATKDRSFCSYVTSLEGSVVVSNSLFQIQRVIRCTDRSEKTLHSLDEYKFFRQRYPRGVDESALVVVSDATIRRWCGPTWRIAASRRTRARATIAEMTVRNADLLIHQTIDGDRRLEFDDSMPNAGKLSLTKNGVRSSSYGTLAFQTPIAELDVRAATKKEVEMYENWRNQYERQWRNAFDPIALKLDLSSEHILADLSVIPLMIRTKYRWWVDWVGDVKLGSHAGDPHPEAIAGMDLAINMNSSPMSIARMFLQQGRNIDLLSWIDGSVSIYLDRDEEWTERLLTHGIDADIEDLVRDVPMGVYVPSKNNLRMTAFIVACRALLEQFAPNMIRWRQVEYKDSKYVVGTIQEGAPVGQPPEEFPQLYYVTTSEGLTLSLNPNVVERAIDRHQDESNPKREFVPEDKRNGPQIAGHISGLGAETMSKTSYPRGTQRMSQLSWTNIPILNYLHRRYPDVEPMVAYERLLGQKLVDPAGGQYEWSDKFRTYVSTHYGHHLSPEFGPGIGQGFGLNDKIETTLSFQDGGLRATLKFIPSKPE